MIFWCSDKVMFFQNVFFREMKNHIWKVSPISVNSPECVFVRIFDPIKSYCRKKKIKNIEEFRTSYFLVSRFDCLNPDQGNPGLFPSLHCDRPGEHATGSFAPATLVCPAPVRIPLGLNVDLRETILARSPKFLIAPD